MSGETQETSVLSTSLSLTDESDIDSLLRALARPDSRILGKVPELASGDLIAHYRIIERLGQGAMGVVYRAFDTKLARDVALKLVASLSVESSEKLRRIAREAQVLAALTHPNLVGVHSLETDGGVMFITMDFIAGENLRQHARGRALEPGEVLRGARELSAGLAEAHTRDVVHCDIKPENIRVDLRGRFVLVDFGLARFVAEPTLEQSSDGAAMVELTSTIAGTPAYMAPERRRGGAADKRTDIWALGLVLFEMATGTRAFDRRGLARLPRPLREPVARCLSTEPGQRYADARALLDDLTPSPRRGTLVAGVALTLALGVGLSARFEDDPCALPNDHLVGVWDSETRAQIVAGFDHSGLLYAADARAEVERELGRYIQSWTQQRRSSCERAVEAGVSFTTSSEHACLDLLWQRVTRLSASFQRAEAATISVAPQLLAELPPARSCAAAAGEEQGRSQPDHDTVFALEDRLTRARQLGSAGEEAKALATVDAVIDDARRLDDKVGHLRALIGKASIGSALPDPGPALQAAHEAIGLAARLGNDEELSEALLTVLQIHTLQDNYEQAEVAGELAQQITLGLGGSHQIVRIGKALGELANERERWDEALAHFESARELAVDLYGEAHLVVGELDLELAWTHGASLRDPQAADRSSAHALEVYRAHYGELHPAVANTYNNIGVLYHIRGEYERAGEALERALHIGRKTRGAEHPETMSTVLNLAVLAQEQGDIQRAITMGAEVVKHRRRMFGEDSTEYAWASRNYAVALQTAGRSREALPLLLQYYEWTLDNHGEHAPITLDAAARLVELATSLDDDELLRHYGELLRAGLPTVPSTHSRYPRLLLAMSMVERQAGQLERALELAEKIVDAVNALSGSRRLDAAYYTGQVVITLFELGRYEQARARALAALDTIEREAGTQPLQSYYLHRVIAQSDARLGRRAAARERLLAQLRLREQTGQQPQQRAQLEVILAELSDDPQERRRRAQSAIDVLETLDVLPSEVARAREVLRQVGP